MCKDIDWLYLFPHVHTNTPNTNMADQTDGPVLIAWMKGFSHLSVAFPCWFASSPMAGSVFTEVDIPGSSLAGLETASLI